MYEYRFLMMSKYNQTRLLQETFKVKQTTLKESHWLIRFYLKQIVSKRSKALVIDYQRQDCKWFFKRVLKFEF